MLVEILPCSAHQRQLSVMLVFHSLVHVLHFSLSPLWLNVQAKKKKSRKQAKRNKNSNGSNLECKQQKT